LTQLSAQAAQQEAAKAAAASNILDGVGYAQVSKNVNDAMPLNFSAQLAP